MSNSGRFELVVPSLDTTPNAQQELQIDPDSLARVALHFLDHPDLPQKRKPNAFVASHVREGQPPLYIRACLPRPQSNAPMPTETAALVDHLHWHNRELQLLEKAGAGTPIYYPALLKDSVRWGGVPLILMAVQAVTGPSNDKLPKPNNSPQTAAVLQGVVSILHRYYDSPEHEHGDVIGDLWGLPQFVGDTVVDLEPHRVHRQSQLEWLAYMVSFGMTGHGARAKATQRAIEQSARKAR